VCNPRTVGHTASGRSAGRRHAGALLDGKSAGAGSPAPAPASPPQGQPGAVDHVLAGAWKIYWLEQNKATEMRVAQVFPGWP
jgi:hypothetical protein